MKVDRLNTGLIPLLVAVLFVLCADVAHSQGCWYGAETTDIRCCDRLLYKFSPGDSWSLHNMSIPNAQGSGSGLMDQYRTLADGTLVYRSKTLDSANPGAYGLSLSNFGPVAGVEIPNLPYVKPTSFLDSLRFELKTNGTRNAFASFSGCDPNRINPETTPCVHSDGYLFFLGNGANYPEELLIEVPDNRQYGPHYDGIAGSMNVSPGGGCITSPCWVAPTPGPYSAIPSTQNLHLYGQTGKSAPNSIDGLCGEDYSLCRGKTLYPRWAIVTHMPNGWFRRATREWWITGLEVWGCVAPTGLFYTLPPCRMLDTRTSGNPVLGSMTVWTYGKCGIPSTARAIVGNVTVVGISPGHLVLLPGDIEGGASTSTINWKTGQTKANNFTVRLAPQGNIRIVTDKYGTAQASAHVIIDVTGYYE